MRYEINVAKDGAHFFGTHERSGRSILDIKKVLDVFRIKFPENEGYEITVSEIPTYSHRYDPIEFMEMNNFYD